MLGWVNSAFDVFIPVRQFSIIPGVSSFLHPNFCFSFFKVNPSDSNPSLWWHAKSFWAKHSAALNFSRKWTNQNDIHAKERVFSCDVE
jgi:hypothetical protein